MTANYYVVAAGERTDVKVDLGNTGTIDSECLGLIRQETRCSLLDFRMRELVANAPLHNSPGKCGLLEGDRSGGAEQAAEEVEELHLERDLLEAAAK